MNPNTRPSFDLDRYSSLPVPELVPGPPEPIFPTRLLSHLRASDGKILGRNTLAAPSDAPINGIGVAPGWLTDTGPVGLVKAWPGAIL